MDEHMLEGFYKEEFLDEFGDTDIVAADILNRKWRSYCSADDSYLSNLKYFCSTGEVKICYLIAHSSAT